LLERDVELLKVLVLLPERVVNQSALLRIGDAAPE